MKKIIMLFALCVSFLFCNAQEINRSFYGTILGETSMAACEDTLIAQDITLQYNRKGVCLLLIRNNGQKFNFDGISYNYMLCEFAAGKLRTVSFILDTKLYMQGFATIFNTYYDKYKQYLTATNYYQTAVFMDGATSLCIGIAGQRLVVSFTDENLSNAKMFKTYKELSKY